MTEQLWPLERAQQWYQAVAPIRGCNYLPRTAVNDTEMWQAETFDLATIKQELGWAQKYGYNSVRVFLQYLVWEADPEGFKGRLATFLETAERHGFRVMPILFDDCAFANREPYLGQQDDPVPGIHNSGWVPSPGLARVTDRSVWPDLERYVKDILSSFADDPRVVVWDLYNEPGNSGMGEKSLPLVEAAFRWARDASPSQPLTAGPWRNFNDAMSQRLIELSDVVSFHSYEEPEGMKEKLGLLAAYGRPMLCTEWLKRQDGSTFEAILPLFEEHDVGWYHWGMVAGRTQTYMPWGSKPGDPVPVLWQHDVLRGDGTPYRRDELEALQRHAMRD